MSEKNVEEFNLAEKSFEITPAKQPMQATLALNAVLLLGAITFVLCILLTVAPLSRLPDPVIQLQTPFGMQLAQVGAWLPNNLGLIANHQDSQASTDYVEFLVLITLAFVIYVLCTLFVLRQTPQGVNNKQYHQTLRLIWLATITAGLIYVFTPAMLSHDIFVYASYSRMMTTYHSNPYFVPLSTFPHDPLYNLNVWANATAAYGPVWLVICSLWGFILGPQPLAYVLSFRLFALVLHLLNTWLVTIILRANRQTSREVILGTLLYAWNPLVLLESSLGGHNDVFMVTFILLGILLSIRADMKNQLTHPRGYLPPMIAFTMATLIKFTTLPLIALFIIFLALRTLRPMQSTAFSFRKALLQRWRPALLTVCIAGITGVSLALVLYGPFWIGHSLNSIQDSFTSPPSARFAQNSILLAIFKWNKANFLPSNAGSWSLGYTLIQVLSSRQSWDIINTIILAGLIIMGAIWLWHTLTLRIFILSALATLGILLIVTPWFFSWYITWLVGLAAICLPLAKKRIGLAFIAFTLTFSASAFLTYPFKEGYAPFGIWMGPVCLMTIGPPLLVFLILYGAWRPVKKLSLDVNKMEAGS